MSFTMCEFHGKFLPEFLEKLFLIYLHVEGDEFEKAIFIKYSDLLHSDLLEDFNCSNYEEWFKLDPLHLELGRSLFLTHFTDEYVESLKKFGRLDNCKSYTDLAELQFELDRLVKKYNSDVETAKRNFRRQTKSKKLPFE